MKKIFKRPALVLTALILAAGLAGCKNASGSEPEFEIEDGVLKKYRGESAEVIIPDGVTKIKEFAFYHNWYIKNATIPEGVTEIGGLAFGECANLESVVIPSTVTIIDDGAFSDCNRLEAIEIPAGVTRICNSTFLRCYALKNVTIPDSVITIGKYAFEGCSLTNSANIKIPDGVTSIGVRAFCDTGITDVEVPGSVEDLSGFQESKLQTVHIKEGVKRINEYAFSYCKKLETITIPSTIERIAYNVFEGCTALSSVNYNGTREKWKNLYNFESYSSKDIEHVTVSCMDGYIKYKKGEVYEESDSSESE